MSNNNDWAQQGSNQNAGQGGQRQQYPGQQQPPQQGQGGGGAPPPNNSGGNALSEGWGTGEAISFDEIKERFGIVSKRALGPILIAWLILGALPLIFNLLEGLLTIVGYYAPFGGVMAAPAAIILAILGFLLWPVTVLLAWAQWALFKPLHDRIFGNPGNLDAMGTLKSASGAMLPTILVSIMVGVMAGIGTLFCVLPGVFIGFVLLQSMYLAAARGVSPGDALKKSFESNKANWQVVLIIVGAAIACWIVGAMVLVPTTFISTLIHPFGNLLMGVVVWGVMQAAYFAVFLVQATVFSCIESKETGRMPVQ